MGRPPARPQNPARGRKAGRPRLPARARPPGGTIAPVKRRRIATAALAAAALLLALAPAAPGASPQAPPNDPRYAPAEGTPDKCATKSADEQQHYLFGFMPQCTQLTASDPENAAG